MSASNRGATRRRMSLLAGGSLMAATLMAFGGTALAPTAALAANECGNPDTNATAADVFQCTDAAPFTSITYPGTNGNLTLQLQNDVTVTTGGIVITPSGTNTVTITRIADTPAAGAGDPQITSTSGAGISVIRPSVATGGNITINLSDNDTGDTPMSVTGLTGILVSNAGSGSTTVTTTNGTITGTAGWGVELGSTGTGNVTFTNRSTTTGTAGAVHVTGGNNATLNNNTGGVLLGSLNFENTGTTDFVNSATWRATGVSNFGAGTSSLSNGGGILAIGGATQGADTLTLSGLETFNAGSVTGGTILFGTNSGYTATDGVANDRLVTSATFTGSRGRMLMDVVLGGQQLDCSAAVTADCLDLRGGTALGLALGSTDTPNSILINPVAGAGTLGARQVLVDISGAGSATERAFVLNSASAGYREVANETPVIDTGPVIYRLLYDEGAQQFYLTSAPDTDLAQLSHLGEAAQVAWDMTTGGWLNRQADLRAGAGQAGQGVWLAALSGSLENAVTQTFSDGAFVSRTGYQQRSTGLVGGADIFGAGGWKVGVTAGYVSSEVEHDAGAATHELKGYSVGAYASMLSGGFFLDAIANYAKLDINSSAFANESDATSMGVQAEGGYRYATPAGIVSIEPLIAVAYVNTEVGEAAFAAGPTASFDDATSLRAALGLRLAGELGSDITTRFSFTGRVWQEFDGEAGVSISSLGGGFTYEDERDVLGDVAFSIGVFGLSEGLTLDATARLKMKEDYSAGDLSIGLRYAF